jgi:hypothetical protein
MVPWKLLKKGIEKRWDVYRTNSMAQQNWVSENQKVESKTAQNFKWERWHGCGHLVYVDDPNLYTETVHRFLSGAERGNAQTFMESKESLGVPQQIEVHAVRPKAHTQVVVPHQVEVHAARPHVHTQVLTAQPNVTSYIQSTPRVVAVDGYVPFNTEPRPTISDGGARV